MPSGRFGLSLLGDELPIDVWMDDQNDQLAQRDAYDTAGREAWDASTRSGENLDASRPSDVAALGMAIPGAAAPQANASGWDTEGGDGADNLGSNRANPSLQPETARSSIPSVRYVKARPGDNISRLIGSSDPRAIGAFARINGMDSRSSAIYAGRVYAIPTVDSAASPDDIAVGRQYLRQDNAHAAALRAQRAASDQFLARFNANKNVWTGQSVFAGPLSISPTRASTNSSVRGQGLSTTTGSGASNPQPLHIGKPSVVDQHVWNGLMQADAAIRGAANTATFGGADRFSAGMDALVSGGLAHWRQRYEANLAQENARDQYDASHRATAQGIGQVGGTAMGLALVPTVGAASLASRLAGAATLTGREASALLAGGAIAGTGVQTVSGMVTGHRSTLGDQAGAAIGGAASGATLPLGPRRAAAIGGWVTSAAQDVFNGRPISLDRAGQSAIAGSALGNLGGRVGAKASNDLPMAAKGRLGEAMGDVRSTINGERRAWGPKSRDYITEDTYWYPDARDARTGRLRFEDKFGYGAELSPNQILAQEILGRDFRLYHFTPDDVGRIASLPAGAVGAQLADGYDGRRH